MNHPDFTQLRRQIDVAITWNDQAEARRRIAEGLRLAQARECPGELLYFRAQAAIVDGDFAGALGLLERALAFNPLDGAAFNDIALCMVEEGTLDGVLEMFDQGLAVEADYATIHHNKGWFLNKIGRPSEALACFERALALEPRRVVTWENMANAYEEQGRISEALGAYRHALVLVEGPAAGIREQLLAEVARLEFIENRRE